jgi:hypothetical protein
VNKSLVCVGGPLDRKITTIEDGARYLQFIERVPLPNDDFLYNHKKILNLTSKIWTYEIATIAVNNYRVITFLFLKDMDRGEAIERIIDGYSASEILRNECVRWRAEAMKLGHKGYF